MARKWYQRGHLLLQGNVWYVKYREDVIVAGKEKPVRIRRCTRLGAKSEFPTKRLAERRAEQILSRINGLDYRPGRVATFDELVERWKAEVLTTQLPSSARAVRSHLRCHILPQLGKLRLEQFGVENQQTFINRVSQKDVSRKTVLNVLGTLSSILTTARNWGYTCEKIDMDKLRLPPRDLDRSLLYIRRSAWCGKTQTTKTKASETVLPQCLPTAAPKLPPARSPSSVRMQ